FPRGAALLLIRRGRRMYLPLLRRQTQRTGRRELLHPERQIADLHPEGRAVAFDQEPRCARARKENQVYFRWQVRGPLLAAPAAIGGNQDASIEREGGVLHPAVQRV